MRPMMMRGVGAALAFCVLLLTFPTPATACIGDCNGDGSVTIEELLQGVNIAQDTLSMAQCPLFDQSGDNDVTIDELLAAVGAALNGCPQPIISTVAGTGLAGLNQDGLPPLESYLYLPQDVTVGPDGYLYIADWNNHRIRRIKDGVIETIAGTGELGDAEDGLAIYTQFNHPTNVEFDRDGNMIVAAWHNSLVKRVYMSGERVGFIENLAGTGARAFGGDEGPGNEAQLDLPSSVAIDSNGNILISDQANYRIRLLEPTGIIHTICGDGTPGYTGDGGRADKARLDSPKGQSAPPAGRICIDGRNNLYIADTGNHVIRLIDSVGMISTIAGTGEEGYSGDGGQAREAQFDTPSDVALGPNGILYVADTMNNVIRAVAPDGTITTFAGTGERGFGGDGGPATAALLDRPYGLTVAPNGDVYVADTHNQRIRKITGVQNGPPPTPKPVPTPQIIPCTDELGSICTYAGNGNTGFDGDGKDRLQTTLYWPFDIEFMSTGRRVILDWNNHKVREILPDDTFKTLVGTDFVGDGPADLSDLTPEGADGLTVDLNHPTDLQEFPNHDILIMAWHNHKIRQIDAVTGRVRVIMGAGPGGFPTPGDGVPAKDARVNQPPHGVLDPDGNLFFIDQRNQRIRVVLNFATERTEAIVQTVVNGTTATNEGGPTTKGFNGDGIALETWVNFPTGGNPEPSGGLALDAAGRLYFSDTNNHRIRRVEFSGGGFDFGIVTTIAGTGEAGYGGDGGQATAAKINYPEDMEIGPDGNLYFADTNNNRVRRINLTTGVIDTVAGTGDKGYEGDGGPALAAKLNRPFGVAFDDKGDLYVSDTFNSRIRKVKLSPSE
jgi:sugar lactone lactonase YvrE